MPGMPPSVSTEKETIAAYLRQQRDGLKYAAFGLTLDQLRETPTKSALSVGGLLKHAANTEKGWSDIILGHPSAGDEDAYADTFSLTESDTLASLIADLDGVAAQTEAAIDSVDDLDQRFVLPPAPWFPEDPAGFSARWILVHIVEELARHAGHADIIREHIDGATMYELMAGAEGWPETPWIKPWRPAEASGSAEPAASSA